MSMFSFIKTLASAVTTPGAGKVALFVDSATAKPMFKDELGVSNYIGEPAQFDEDPSTTIGLTWGYLAGAVRNGTSVVRVAAGTVTLTASTTNYVEVTAAGVVSDNITAFTAGSIPLRTVVTGATTITTSTYELAWLSELDLSGLVPYTGATADVDLGVNKFIVNVNQLYVDPITGYIGIGTTTPSVILSINKENNNLAQTKILHQEIKGTATGFIDYFDFYIGASQSRGGSIVFGEIGGGFSDSGIDFALSQTEIYQGGSYPLYLTTNGVKRITILGNGFVGIGAIDPKQALEVNGGLRLHTATLLPSADINSEGTIWVVEGASGVADTLQVCLKSAADTYSWITLATG